jgi:hypothetical protein
MACATRGLRPVVVHSSYQEYQLQILALDRLLGARVDALMYVELAKATLRKGYTWMDMSVTGEDNPQTNKPRCRRMSKRYRIFELAL